MNGIDLSFLPLLFGAVALIGVIVSIFIKEKKIKTLNVRKRKVKVMQHGFKRSVTDPTKNKNI